MKFGLRHDHYKEVKKPLDVILVKEGLDDAYEAIQDSVFYIRECNPDHLDAEKVAELDVLCEAFDLLSGMMERIYV